VQKLVQDSNVALETYQQQVRTLEEYIARGDGRYVAQPPFPRFSGPGALIEREGWEGWSSFRWRGSRSNSPRQSRPRHCAAIAQSTSTKKNAKRQFVGVKSSQPSKPGVPTAVINQIPQAIISDVGSWRVANAALSARALQLAQDATAAQEELRAVNVVSEREEKFLHRSVV
jgi:hypothetical protein